MADYEVRKISDIEEVASLKGAKALVTDSSNKARRVDLTYIHDIALGAENNAKNGPKIVDGEWYVFDYESGEYKATGVTVLERDEFDALVNLLASMWYFDSDGNLVTDKQVKVNGNLIVTGDTATGGTGQDTPSTGGGIDEAELAEYLTDNNYVNSVATLAAVLGYTPVNPSSLAAVATSGSYTDLSNRPTSMKSPYALTINNSAGTAQVSYDGSETKSITLTKSMVGLGNVANSTYAGGTAVTLNGTSKASATASFYAPTSAGTSGQLLVSTGGAPSWVSKSSISLSAFDDDVVAGKYQPLSTAINTENIGSQSVHYATSAGNADAATKLATARTIWGQSFDGTGNVTGALSGVTNINSALYINSSGNVTIGSSDLAGTDSITPKLYVNGKTRFAGSIYFGDNSYINYTNVYLPSNDGSNSHQIHSSSGLLAAFYSDGRTYMAGNVGIGTTSPSYLLHVSGNARVAANLSVGGWLNLSGTASMAGAVTMSSTLSVTGNVTASANVFVGNSITGPLPSGGSYRRWRITMSDPATWIQAASFDGTSTAGNLYLTGYSAGTLASCMIKATATTITGTLYGVDGNFSNRVYGKLVYVDDTATCGMYMAGGSDYASLYTTNAGAWQSTNIRLYSDSSVGIHGLLRPTSDLGSAIGSSSYRWRSLFLASNSNRATGDDVLSINDTRTTSGYQAIRFLRNGADYAALQWFHDGFNNTSYWWNVASCINLDTTPAGGCITLGPWNAPIVVVDKANTRVIINGNLIVSGDTATGSDIRFKDIIEDRTIDIRAMADAPLFTFTWNDRDDDTVHLGSSAQYWEKVAPWLVKGEDFKHLDYATLGVAMAVSLAKKTVDIEERMKVLEKENKVLKKELRRIRNGAVC